MVSKKEIAKSNYVPQREIELNFLTQLSLKHPNAVLAGVDEVGRGALAGPVSVGIALIDATVSDSFPEKLRDSKQISPRVRESLVMPCKNWVLSSAVGNASVEIINKYGIIAGLRFAAADAVMKLAKLDFRIDGVLLDGSHNWWNANSLFDSAPTLPDVPVKTVVKADAQCAVVAAASVLAKVRRDEYMVDLSDEFPQYDWVHNKGYSSKKHIAALKQFGPSKWHRTAWKLPGVAERSDAENK